MTDMQDVNVAFARGKENSELVLTPTVKNLSYFSPKEISLWGERTSLRKSFERSNDIVKTIEPALRGLGLMFCQP